MSTPSKPRTRKLRTPTRGGDWLHEPMISCAAYLHQRDIPNFGGASDQVKLLAEAFAPQYVKLAISHENILIDRHEVNLCLSDAFAELSQYFEAPGANLRTQSFGVNRIGALGLFLTTKEVGDRDPWSVPPYASLDLWPTALIARSDEESRQHWSDLAPPVFVARRDPRWRDVVHQWYTIIDQRGDAGTGMGVCDTTADLGYGLILGDSHPRCGWRAEAESLAWMASRDDRYLRVRCVQWCVYLGAEATQKFDPLRQRVDEFRLPRGDDPTHTAHYLPGGGSIYFTSIDPLEAMSRNVGATDTSVSINIVWLHERLRKAGML